jgi:type I restriction enzyme S subunit
MADEWRDVLLEELAEDVTVGFVGPMASEYVPQGIPFLRSQNVEPLLVNDFDLKFITPTFHERLRKSALSPGDVVIVRTGKPGACAVIPSSLPVANCSDLVIVRCGPELDARFLAYYVNSVAAHHVDSHLVGAVQQHFNVGSARKLLMHLPSVMEQRAIAHILGALDDKIELNRRMNETLEAMARAVFKSWFVDFDPVRAKAEGRDSGLPQPLADLFPDSFEDSELGEIPKGWAVGTLGTLGELAIGGDWGEDEAFAGAVEASCLRGVDLEHLRQFGHASAPRRWFKPLSLERRAMDDRDVLVAGSGAGPTGRPLWMCADLLEALGPCVYSNFCKRIRCGTAAKAVYLDAWLHGMRESGEIWEHVNGTSVPNLDASSLLAGKEIPLPPVPILDKYHAFVRPIWRELYAGQNRTLAALRDTLLPKLISGELRVPDTAASFGGSA